MYEEWGDIENTNEVKEYNKTVYEGYKVGHFRKDGSVSSVSRINNRDVENLLSTINMGFVPQQYKRINERPYNKLQHACLENGVTYFTHFNCVYLYNTPIYYIGCPACRTVYYYCVKVQDLEVENLFKNMGIIPSKIVLLDSAEYEYAGGIPQVRHCCKEVGITKYNLLIARGRNMIVHYAICPKCGKLYYYKGESYTYE